MSQVDVEWPSEDEDFDATVDAASKSTKTATKAAEVEESPAQEAPAEPEPSEPEAPAEPEAPQEEAPEPEAPAEPTPVADQPPAQPVVTKPPKVKGPKKDRSGMLRLIGEGVLVLAVIGLALWGWNLSSENNNLQAQVDKLNANPQAVIQKQTDSLINSVGKLITLPTGETPTIANVTDAAQAKKQSAFFDNAQNGDKVLMYVKAGEAILYRPSTGKIILVAPLTFNNTTATTPTTTTKK